MIDSVLDPIADRLFREAHAEGRREPAAAYRLDALIEVMRLAAAFQDGELDDDTYNHFDDTDDDTSDERPDGVEGDISDDVEAGADSHAPAAAAPADSPDADSPDADSPDVDERGDDHHEIIDLRDGVTETIDHSDNDHNPADMADMGETADTTRVRRRHHLEPPGREPNLGEPVNRPAQEAARRDTRHPPNQRGPDDPDPPDPPNPIPKSAAKSAKSTNTTPPTKTKTKTKLRWRTGSLGSRAKVIVRIDLPALQRGHAQGHETCDIAGVGAVPVSLVRQLIPDAFLALIVTKGQDVHTVAHAGRGATAYQRTALEYTEGACSTEGCPNRSLREIDHTQEWARTHHTTLTELLTPCKACHQLRTNHGYRYGPKNPLTGKNPLNPPATAD